MAGKWRRVPAQHARRSAQENLARFSESTEEQELVDG